MNRYANRLTFRLGSDTIAKLRFLADRDHSSLGRILRILIENAYAQATVSPNLDTRTQ